MSETQEIGATAAWAIKGFSVTLREEITKAARLQDCTVSDWLHAHFQKHGVDGVQVDLVKIAQGSPSDGYDELHRLVASSALLAEHFDTMPKSLRAALARALRGRLPPPKPRNGVKIAQVVPPPGELLQAPGGRVE